MRLAIGIISFVLLIFISFSFFIFFYLPNNQLAAENMFRPEGRDFYDFAVIDLEKKGAPFIREDFWRHVHLDVDMKDAFLEGLQAPTDSYLFIFNKESFLARIDHTISDYGSSISHKIKMLDSNRDGVIDSNDGAAKSVVFSAANRKYFFVHGKQDLGGDVRSIKIFPFADFFPSRKIGFAILNYGRAVPIYSVRLRYTQIESSFINIAGGVMISWGPHLPAKGVLPDLMSSSFQDERLAEMLEEFRTAPVDYLLDCEEADMRIEGLLYRWAGVDDIDPQSRGMNIDARRLAFIEKYTDKKFIQRDGSVNPSTREAAILVGIWHDIYQKMRGALILQVAPNREVHRGVWYDITYDYFKRRNVAPSVAVDEYLLSFPAGEAGIKCRRAFLQHLQTVWTN